jgi:GxxExxY protein
LASWKTLNKSESLSSHDPDQADLVVADAVVVETKSVEALAPIHEAQLVTYLRIGGWKVGLLINFNEILLKNGIRRKVLNAQE